MDKTKLGQFRNDGWCHLSDPVLADQIEALIDDILAFSHKIYGVACPKEEGIAAKSALLSERIGQFAKQDRQKLSFVYDGIKNLPAFHAFYSNETMIKHCRALLASPDVLVIKDSVGIRIDLPDEDQQLTTMHQEFHSFPYALSGLVVWTPLTDVDLTRGTLAIWDQTHRDVCRYDGDQARIDALLSEGRLQEAQKVGQLQLPENLGDPLNVQARAGDVFFMSALELHQSVAASGSSGARLTCQFRVFDYSDPFFLWKSRNHRFNDGLKEPIGAQNMYDRFKRETNL